MENFWDYKVWGPLLIFVALLGSLLVGNILKKSCLTAITRAYYTHYSLIKRKDEISGLNTFKILNCYGH